MKQRSDYCGNLRENSIGKEITLYGWVNSYRNHGSLIFVDIRDREGILQLVFDPNNRKSFQIATQLRNEYVISVTGVIQRRPKGTCNNGIGTGTIELLVDHIYILNTSENLPFPIATQKNCSEELRLKYRYLDLRRPQLQHNLITRSKISKIIRDFLHTEQFIEIETPSLTKSTPEGARDFLVPSRIYHGKFFALPQSPQIFKQILMISGFDKYYQIVKCFRDEDLRSDRQIEFTQIDIEMSYINESIIMNLIERMISKIFKLILNIDLEIPFKCMTYEDAILKYGSENPDIRFNMEIKNLSHEFKDSRIFSTIISQGGTVQGLCIPNGAILSKSTLKNIIEFVKMLGAKGLSWVKSSSKGIESNLEKIFSKNELSNILLTCNVKQGDLLVFIADGNKNTVINCLGQLRLKIGNKLGMGNDKKFSFLWVVDFPLITFNTDQNKFESFHHPFTAPKNDLDLFSLKNQRNIGFIKSKSYDIILNGIEIGGGSIRINKNDVQRKIFDLLRISYKDYKNKFGFLLDALSYGAPPHGGIALGFDRLCALILGTKSIREVIAFPKTQNAIDLMVNAPNDVNDEQLLTLGINRIMK
ncbi:MAG: aspartate--tRNA ligase [Endomicrobium sp.]|jgi:aspartyl-tRNA synthetase|nr:aspartate--tRNA ligase [Endomicrobium sp.]